MAREKTTDREFAERCGRYSSAPSYFEFNERITQRSVSHDVIEFPDVYVTESVLNDDEQNELRREISRLAIRAMRAEETV